MADNTLTPIRGSTACSASPAAAPAPPSAPVPPPRHRVGDVLRAVGVFVDTAFRVVVLGTDGTKQPDPPSPSSVIPRQSGTTRS